MDAVKLCVEELGGKISIASERNRGTTITIKIPKPKSDISSLKEKIV